VAPTTAVPRLPGRLKVLFGASCLSAAGSGLILPFTGIYLATVLHLGTAAAAIYFGVVAVASLLSSLFGGHITDRLGGRLAGAVGASTQCAAILALSQCSNIRDVCTAATIMGVGNGLYYPALTPTVVSLVPGDLRRHAFSMRYVLMNTGVILGASLGALVVSGATTPPAFRLIFIADAMTFLPVAVCFSLLGARALHADESRVSSTAREGPVAVYRRLLKSRALLLVLVLQALVPLFGYTQLEVTAPLIANRLMHLPNLVIGNMIVANAIAVVILRRPVRKYCAKSTEQALIVATGLVWLAAYAIAWPSCLAPYRAVQVGCLALFCMVFAIGELLYSSAQSPLLTRLCTPDTLGRATALGGICWNTGQLVGPIFGASLVANCGTGQVWAALMGGALLIVIAATALVHVLRNQSRHPDERMVSASALF
jgi:MFS family permease